MTVLANIGRLHVRWVFASRGDAVMAVAAVSGDAGMIEVSGNPAGG